MDESKPYVKPGFVMSRLINPITRHLPTVTTLVVRGRTGGELRHVPLGRPFEHAGRRYLVSGRGNTHWVRNLRAAGMGELRSHGRAERFRAVEIEGPERKEIVTACRSALCRSVDPYFSQIPDPADHPVFRIDPPEES